MNRFCLMLAANTLFGLSINFSVAQAAPNYPITANQKSTAQKVAQAGVALSELAPNAPDSYTVKRGDTLWDISKIFLKSPWRWPELWGMNLDQIRNPHLIYPGQILYLDKSNGRAVLRLGKPVGSGGVVKLSPRMRVGELDDPISSVPVQFLLPFFNEAVIFENDNALATAPRIVATQEGRVVVTTGEKAYVRGGVGDMKQFQVFRDPKPLLDPATQEVLGYEAVFVGKAALTQEGSEDVAKIVPSSIVITGSRIEASVGDRLSPLELPDFEASPPRAPANAVAGQVASLYGEGLTAGQNQIVALNRGKRDGLERGHVLVLWRAGAVQKDTTDPERPIIHLPNERQGYAYVFRVFDKMAYALILSVQEPVKAGDHFSNP